jgi:hypothetical protein
MPNPSQQPLISKVLDSTESYTMLSGLVKRFTFAQVKSWINSWILPTVVGSRVVGTDVLLEMSDGTFITIEGVVPTNQYQHRYRARFDLSNGEFTIPVVASSPYQSSIMIFASGVKQPQEGQYQVSVDNLNLTTTFTRESLSEMPVDVDYEVIAFFSDSSIGNGGSSGVSRLDIVDENKIGDGTHNITFNTPIASGSSNWIVLVNGLDEKLWTRVGQVFTFNTILISSDKVTLRIFIIN